MRLDLRLHDLQPRFEEVLLQLVALACSSRAWSRACFSRSRSPATTTQPKPTPRPIVMLTPESRSVNMCVRSRPLTTPAMMVPRKEPAMIASTCMCSRFTPDWRMFPATVNSTMLV
jgi:hypothetical protein